MAQETYEDRKCIMKKLLPLTAIIAAMLFSGCATRVEYVNGPPPPTVVYYNGPEYDVYYGPICPGPGWFWWGGHWRYNHHGYAHRPGWHH